VKDLTTAAIGRAARDHRDDYSFDIPIRGIGGHAPRSGFAAAHDDNLGSGCKFSHYHNQ
jgi:hypothetical protein